MSTNDIFKLESEKNDERFTLLNFSERHESKVRTYSRDFPCVFYRAKNSWLFSETGKPYLDFFQEPVH